MPQCYPAPGGQGIGMLLLQCPTQLLPGGTEVLAHLAGPVCSSGKRPRGGKAMVSTWGVQLWL